MEQFNRTHPAPFEHSRVSSISSLDSVNDSAHSGYNGSTKSTHVRSASAMPSYMKAAPIKRKPVSPKAPQPEPDGSSNSLLTSQDTTAALRSMTQGTLLLAVAASPHSSTMFYVESMLRKFSYRQIVVLAHSGYESALKRLKVDVYALLGRLGQEAKVELDLRSTWTESEIDAATSQLTTGGDAIYAVLCSPLYDSVGPGATDIMALERDELVSQWSSSVGFLHTIAKYALPNFPSNSHEHQQAGLFLVTSPLKRSSIATVHDAACRAFAGLLAEANATKKITIGYADNVLLPEPEPESQPAKLNGGNRLPSLQISKAPRTDDDPPPESPTKLWALYNDMWVAD